MTEREALEPHENDEGGTENDAPPPLFHYTSQEGLLGIVQDGVLRCSNAHYLSDAQELGYTVDLARPLLERRLEDLRSGEDSPQGMIDFLGHCQAWVRGLSHNSQFVFSLSEHGNSLSQWRAYCPPEGGYSIGFDRRRLRDLGRDQDFLLVECIYDETAQVAAIEDAIDEAIDDYEKALQNEELDSEETQREPAVGFGIQMSALAAQFKHPAFSDEDEWRLISPPWGVEPVDLEFREGPSTPIPYSEFNLREANDGEDTQPLPISKVWVGPTPHPDLAVRSVATLLGTHGVSEPDVEFSGIPYRTW